LGKIRDLFNGITLPQQTKTQVLVADKLFSELEARTQDLESQLLHARADVNPLKRENERLKEQLTTQASKIGKLTFSSMQPQERTQTQLQAPITARNASALMPTAALSKTTTTAGAAWCARSTLPTRYAQSRLLMTGGPSFS
jgi:hypothetical protein